MNLFYAFLLTILLPVDLIGMHRHRIERCDTERVLIDMGNVYDPEPKVDAPLDERLVMNEFYRRLKSKSPEEIKSMAQVILALPFNNGRGHTLKRYHVAGLVLAGADPNINATSCVRITLLQEAVLRSDYELCRFLLEHKAAPNEGGEFGPALFLCKTVRFAQLFLDNAADPQVARTDSPLETLLLHHVARSTDYEIALINLYRSKGVSVFKCNMLNGTPLCSLALGVTNHQESDIKKKLDALLHGLNLPEKKALFAVPHQNYGTVFELLQAKSQYEREAYVEGSESFVKNERKRKYFKALLEDHLAEN